MAEEVCKDLGWRTPVAVRELRKQSDVRELHHVDDFVGSFRPHLTRMSLMEALSSMHPEITPARPVIMGVDGAELVRSRAVAKALEKPVREVVAPFQAGGKGTAPGEKARPHPKQTPASTTKRSRAVARCVQGAVDAVCANARRVDSARAMAARRCARAAVEKVLTHARARDRAAAAAARHAERPRPDPRRGGGGRHFEGGE